MIDKSLPIQPADVVPVTEIRWTPLDAVPRLELLAPQDLLALDPDELLTYVLDLQDELEAVRTVLSESLSALHQAHHQRGQLQVRVRQLLDALDTARETIRALGADLRAYQEGQP